MGKLGRLFGGLSLLTWMIWALASLVSPARAETVDTVTGLTVGTSSGLALAAGTRQYLLIDNESATATIACNFGGTAALNTAGNFTIPPQTQRVWPDNNAQSPTVFRPTISLQINCIASALTTPITFEYH